MVREYLLNYKNELIEKKIDYNKLLQKNEFRIKETTEFIRLIEESEDKSYESFSPQSFGHDINVEKTKELKEEQKDLELENEKLKNKIQDINHRIEELESIINLLKETAIKESNKKNELDDNQVFHLKLLETQEYERQRIARELHDSTVQSLTSMIHKIEICSKLMDMDPTRCKMELDNLTNLVRETIQDMREVIYNLRPMSLDDIGLDAAIERELDKIKRNNDIETSLEIKGSIINIKSVIGLSILRIIQEACNNTIKHAGAKNIKITMTYESDHIDIEISDDGCGFDVEKVKNFKNEINTGFGISMMHERIFLLSGSIEIKSKENKGTTLFITIPIKEESATCQ